MAEMTSKSGLLGKPPLAFLPQRLLTRALLLLAVALPLSAQPRVVTVDIDSVVHPITAEIVRNAIQSAHRDGAAAVLLRLDTPGGLLEATRDITERILDSPIPVITFVKPGGRAASAGFFILLSGHVAAMAPGTHTGAASPVLLGQPMDPVMRQKVESDAAANLRALAARRHRDAAVAEKAVLEAKSFTDQEALAARLIDLIAPTDDQLFSLLQGREVELPGAQKSTLALHGAIASPYPLTLRERTVSAIADPNLAFALLILGGLLLYVEFTSPGLIAPGLIGSILFLLGLMSISVLPINAAGVALLILAIVLFVLEFKIASHGLLAAGGAVAMVLGALLLVDGPPEMRIHLRTALAVGIGFAAVSMMLVTLILKARRQPVATGELALLRESGTALTPINPRGKVFLHGEYWDAEADQPIAQGAKVKVLAVNGLLLKVEKGD
jgi:membrane-bound serine protease (ClpP class)